MLLPPTDMTTLHVVVALLHFHARACHFEGDASPMIKTYQNILPAFHVPNNYGKMVPLRHPMVKPYPPQGSYNSKIGEGGEVTW